MNSPGKNSPAQALYFGSGEATQFGWLHDADPQSYGHFGLVICGSFGFESLHSHRSLRQLAISAAEAGVPSMRFDYPGCGNSSGDEYEPDLVDAWLRSVHAAADELKRRTGLKKVCLLGLRLGVLLATQAALDRDDLVGLIAIAPVLQGRQFIREMRALSATGSAAELIGRDGETLIEAAGFFVTDSTAQALSRLDVRTPARAPAEKVLIVQRDDMPSTPRWRESLSALGAVVHDGAWPGYKSMMLDPQTTQVPVEMIQNIVSVLRAWGLEDATTLAQKVANVEATQPVAIARERDCSYAAKDFHETAVQIDAGGSSLFGIVTTSASTNAQPSVDSLRGKVGVLLVNQGCVHHIGPSRLWVLLARKWAKLGMVVLRVDLSGIGESNARPGVEENLSYAPGALQDVDEALKYLHNQCGADSAHMVGMCSGAYHAFQSAVTGLPLHSVFIINPWVYTVAEAQATNVLILDYELDKISASYKSKIFSLAPWRKLLSGRLDFRYLWEFFLSRTTNKVVLPLKKFVQKIGINLSTPISHDLGLASNNSALLQFVFSEGDDGLDILHRNAPGLLGKLEARQKLSLDIIPSADHNFLALSGREKLIELIDRKISDSLLHNDTVR